MSIRLYLKSPFGKKQKPFPNKLGQFNILQEGRLFFPHKDIKPDTRALSLVRETKLAIPTLQTMYNCFRWSMEAKWAGAGNTRTHLFLFLYSPSSLPQFRWSLCIQGIGGGRGGRNWVTYSSSSFLKNLAL